MIIAIAFSLLLANVVMEKKEVQAATVKSGKYFFSSGMVKSFSIKKGKMTIKVQGKITKENNDNFGKKKMKIKVSKRCKYISEFYDRYKGKSYKEKTNYSGIKDSIKYDRQQYKENGYCNNVGMSYFVVKKGKVVKIVYFYM